jgi:hypothetical protein
MHNTSSWQLSVFVSSLAVERAPFATNQLSQSHFLEAELVASTLPFSPTPALQSCNAEQGVQPFPAPDCKVSIQGCRAIAYSSACLLLEFWIAPKAKRKICVCPRSLPSK